MTSTMRRTTQATLLVLLAGSVGACKNFDIPNYQAGSTDAITGPSATVTSVMTAAQGLAIGTRGIGIVVTFGTIGREGYSLNPTSGSGLAPYFEAIDRQLGSGVWSSGYGAIRQANVVLTAVDGLAGLTAAQKDAVRGWAKTLIAYDLLLVIDVMDVSGAAVDVNRGVDDPLAPIVTRAEVFQRIVQLLDEARTHLLAGGTAFPFAMPKGFASFATPADFLKVNRAIRARVEVYRGSLANLATPGSGTANYTTALQDVTESFLSTTAALSLGAYNTYGTGSTDAVNGLYDPVPRTLVAHQNTIVDAQLQADGVTPDTRATAKTAAIPPRAFAGVTTSLKWNIYKAPDDPDPLIRNEELILLRAEARYFTGDVAGALADINHVRTVSGGLAPLGGFADATAFIDELLYNRRYSLVWEGAHRWIDMRRYGRLATLPRARTGDKVFPYAPLPDAECIPREPDPPGCAIPTAL